MIKLLPLIDGQPGRVVNIGLQARPIGDQNIGQFSSYVVGGRLDGIEPREILTLEEFQCGDFRKVHEGRAGKIGRAPAAEQLQALVHPRLRLAAVARPDAGQLFLNGRAERCLIRGDGLLRVFEQILEGRRRDRIRG